APAALLVVVGVAALALAMALVARVVVGGPARRDRARRLRGARGTILGGLATLASSLASRCGAVGDRELEVVEERGLRGLPVARLARRLRTALLVAAAALLVPLLRGGSLGARRSLGACGRGSGLAPGPPRAPAACYVLEIA